MLDRKGRDSEGRLNHKTATIRRVGCYANWGTLYGINGLRQTGFDPWRNISKVALFTSRNSPPQFSLKDKITAVSGLRTIDMDKEQGFADGRDICSSVPNNEAINGPMERGQGIL